MKRLRGARSGPGWCPGAGGRGNAAEDGVAAEARGRWNPRRDPGHLAWRLGVEDPICGYLGADGVVMGPHTAAAVVQILDRRALALRAGVQHGNGRAHGRKLQDHDCGEYPQNHVLGMRDHNQTVEAGSRRVNESGAAQRGPAGYPDEGESSALWAGR